MDRSKSFRLWSTLKSIYLPMPPASMAFPMQMFRTNQHSAVMGSEEILCARAPDRDLVSFDGLEQRRRIAQQRPTVKMNKRIALFPIIFFQIYLATSVLTFAFGPWQWPVSNPWQLYSFLILAQVALLAGYLKAIKKHPRPASTKLRVPVAVVVSLVFNYLWIGQTYKLRSGQDFDLSGFFAGVISGL